MSTFNVDIISIDAFAASPMRHGRLPDVATGKGFKVTFEEGETPETEILDLERARLRKAIKEKGLLDDSPRWKTFVLDELPDPNLDEDLPRDSLLRKKARLVLSSPLFSDQEEVYQTAETIAHNILDPENTKDRTETEYQKAVDNIITTLYHTIDRTLRKMDEHELLKGGKRGNKFSSKNVRDAVKEVKKEINDSKYAEENADIKLGQKLGILPKNIDKESREKIKENLGRAQRKAILLYNEIWRNLEEWRETLKNRDPLLRGEALNGIVRDEIKPSTLFQLLDKIINQSKEEIELTSTKGDTRKERLRTYNEAQTIAYLTYIFYEVITHPLYEKSKAQANKIHGALLDSLFPHSQHADRITHQAKKAQERAQELQTQWEETKQEEEDLEEELTDLEKELEEMEASLAETSAQVRAAIIAHLLSDNEAKTEMDLEIGSEELGIKCEALGINNSTIKKLLTQIEDEKRKMEGKIKKIGTIKERLEEKTQELDNLETKRAEAEKLAEALSETADELRMKKINIFTNENGNIVHHQTEGCDFKPEHLRRLTLKNHKKMGEQFVLLDGDTIRPKSALSIVKKLFLRPELDMETIPDAIAGQMILWDITTHDIDTGKTNEDGTEITPEDYREYFIDIGKRIGEETLDLEFQNLNVDYRNLEPGKFTVNIDKLYGNSENERSRGFRACKVYGKTKEGVLIEFQIIPRDIWEQTQSKSSPSSHELYDLRRTIELAEIFYQASTQQRIREVAKILEKNLEEMEIEYEQTYKQDMEADQAAA